MRLWKMITRFFTRPPVCTHSRPKFEMDKPYPVSTRVSGVTLDWGGRPTPFFEWTGPCGKCGETYTTSGILPSKNHWSTIVKSDADGWPIDDHGCRYPVLRSDCG